MAYAIFSAIFIPLFAFAAIGHYPPAEIALAVLLDNASACRSGRITIGNKPRYRLDKTCRASIFGDSNMYHILPAKG